MTAEPQKVSSQIIRPLEILDSTYARQLRKEVNTAVEAGVKFVLINLQQVTFMDSSGLGALVVALKTVQSAGSKLYLCSVNNQIKMLLELTNMDQVFEVLIDEDEFRKKLELV